MDDRPAYCVVQVGATDGRWFVVAACATADDAREQFRRLCVLHPGRTLKRVTVHEHRAGGEPCDASAPC